MRKLIVLTISILCILSCKKDDLSTEFNCSGSDANYELKEYQDIFKKFKIELPKNWKTQLYYDEYQSQIFSADTTQNLSNAYIVDVSWHQGELNLDTNFAQRVKDTLAATEQLNVINSNFNKFKNKPSYWTFSEGRKGKYSYKNLQLYVKTKTDEYYTFTTKIYGDNNINERICEALTINNSITFIE